MDGLEFYGSVNMLKVLAYTGGWNSPSGVFRVRQYINPLETFGIEMRDCPSWAGAFPPLRKWVRPAWGVWNIVDRVPDVLRSFGYNLIFFQREMLSTFTTWEPITKRPRVLDVDDAIWAHRRGDFARRLAEICEHVICGNQFLAEQFSRWNPQVSILPTPVDTNVFCPGEQPAALDRPVIGWMGLPSGFNYLYTIERALAAVLERHPEAVLRIVSSRRPEFRNLPPEQVQWIPWSQKDEAGMIQDMTIGIMPLDDSLFARGKCSFKMLLYMACGLPVIVSPVGMNAEVLGQGNVGFGPTNESEWVEGLSELLKNAELRSEMGRTGREMIVKQYSVQALAPQLAKTLLHVGGK